MNVKKLISKLLIVIMLLGVFYVPTVASAETKSKEYLKINNTVLEFDKIIYVNQAKGDDKTADGSQERPYKTLEEATKAVTVPEYSYCFKLSPGAYNQGKWLRNTCCKNQITIIGNGYNTILNTKEGFNSDANTLTDPCQCKFVYIGLRWYDTIPGLRVNRHVFLKPVELHNVYFATLAYQYLNGDYFITNNSTIELNNCVTHSEIPTGKGTKVTNCYGNFRGKSGSPQSNPDYKTNLIVKNMAYSHNDHKIGHKGWKNSGTGKNPDGSQAHIGLLGGPFALKNDDTLDCSIVTNEISTQSKLKVVLEPKETLQLSVDEELETNMDMNWSSLDETVASVDASGMVTATKAGDTTITVTSKNGEYTDVIHILVVDDAKELRLAIDLKSGMSRRVTIDDLTDTKKVTWVSMDETVATVNAKGRITATGSGLTFVTAIDESGTEVGQIYVRVRN